MSKRLKFTEELESKALQLYRLGWKDSEISKELGVCARTIHQFRKKNNLPINFGAKAKAQQGIIWEMYKEGKTLPEISKATNIKTYSLRVYFQNTGLKHLSKARSFKNNEYKIGKRELSILIGILLGDGTIEINKDRKLARFVVRHGPKQKKYSDYIFNCFRHMRPKYSSVKIKGHILNGKIIESQIQSEIRLNRHPKLTELYKAFYSNKKKIIPFNLLGFYTAESLAFHFMDDGSKTIDSNGKINGFILSTESFTPEENMGFIWFLKGKFNLDCSYQKSNNNIRIKANSVDRFIRIVRPYIIESLQYKISPSKTS